MRIPKDKLMKAVELQAVQIALPKDFVAKAGEAGEYTIENSAGKMVGVAKFAGSYLEVTYAPGAAALMFAHLMGQEHPGASDYLDYNPVCWSVIYSWAGEWAFESVHYVCKSAALENLSELALKCGAVLISYHLKDWRAGNVKVLSQQPVLEKDVLGREQKGEAIFTFTCLEVLQKDSSDTLE